MSCSFVGICKLLTPEWVSALSDVVGAIALVGGAIIGEVIRRRIQAKNDLAEAEHMQRVIMEAQFRMRSVSEILMSVAGQIRRDVEDGRFPIGYFGEKLQIAMNRFPDLEFSVEEKVEFGPHRTLVLIALTDVVRRSTELFQRAVEKTRRGPYMEDVGPEDRETLLMISEHLDSLSEAIIKALEELAKPHYQGGHAASR